MTLVEFLTARLDEDEAFAADRLDSMTVRGFLAARMLRARMLREAKAKRAVMAEYRAADPYEAGGFHAALRHLAAVYAEHPDYREEWWLDAPVVNHP